MIRHARSGGVSVTLDQRLFSWEDRLPNTPSLFVADADSYGASLDWGEWFLGGGDEFSIDPDHIWRTQPHVKTVIKFLAKNLAQLDMHSFVRGPDGSRERVRSSAAAQVVKHPHRGPGGVDIQTRYEVLFNMVVDLCLRDRYAAVVTLTDHGWRMTRVPPKLWRFRRDEFDVPSGITVRQRNGAVVEMSLSRLFWLDAYPSAGSPMDAIKQILLEEFESASFRADLWKNGARNDTVISRPLNAPPWSNEVRSTFRESWSASSRSGGGARGGTRLLEDGMTATTQGRLSPHDAEQMKARILSKAEVASYFGVDVALVGGSESANYSNVSAYSAILDTAVLSSFIVQIQQAYNGRVLPLVGADPAEYVEFSTTRNRGNREKLLESLQKSTGGVGLLGVNEAREIANLNRIDNPLFDEPIVPIFIAEPKPGDESEPKEES